MKELTNRMYKEIINFESYIKCIHSYCINIMTDCYLSQLKATWQTTIFFLTCFSFYSILILLFLLSPKGLKRRGTDGKTKLFHLLQQNMLLKSRVSVCVLPWLLPVYKPVVSILIELFVIKELYKKHFIDVLTIHFVES